MVTELSQETGELLRVLALVDITFAPMPCPRTDNLNCCEIFHQRLAYRRGAGLPWTVGGSAEDRKHGERVLANLRQASLVVLPKSRGKHRQVGLTPRGDDLGRSLLGYWRAADCWHLLQAMSEAVDDRRGTGPTGKGVWLLERQLEEAIGDSAERAQAMVLPLQARGLISVGIDTVGGLYYTVTTEGKVAARGPAPEPQDQVERDERAVKFYWEAYRVFEHEREGWRPAGSNECYVSFPALH